MLHGGKDFGAIRFTRELDVEVPRLQLEKGRQKVVIVDVRAVSRVVIATWAGVDPEPAALVHGEAGQDVVVQLDEAA